MQENQCTTVTPGQAYFAGNGIPAPYRFTYRGHGLRASKKRVLTYVNARPAYSIYDAALPDAIPSKAD
jgi:hypothetical protein